MSKHTISLQEPDPKRRKFEPHQDPTKKQKALDKYFEHLKNLNETTFQNVEVAWSEKRGRHLVAKRHFEPGETIFEERVLLYASDDPSAVCIACDEDHKGGACDAPDYAKFVPFENTIASIENISEETQTGQEYLRMIIKLIVTLKEYPDSHLWSLFALESNAPETESFDQTAELLYQVIPKSHQDVLSIAEIKSVLGIFHVNSHEMNNINNTSGTGIFPLTAMINHGCRENCAFYATAYTMGVVCQDPIPKGVELQINYGPSYLPSEEQFQYLQDNYNFICSCSFCDTTDHVIDVCRAFFCPDKSCTGIVHPLTPRNVSPLGPHQWKCSSSTCVYKFSDNDTQTFLKAETAFQEEDESQDLDNLLHESHYLIHENMSVLADNFISEGRYEDTTKLINARISNLHRTLTTYHRSKVTEYDRLARAWILQAIRGGAGNEEEERQAEQRRQEAFARAKQAYEDAYEISVKCFGHDKEPTLHCKRRSENPPTTEEALEKEYGEGEAEDDEDDGEGEDNDDRNEEGGSDGEAEGEGEENNEQNEEEDGDANDD